MHLLWLMYGSFTIRSGCLECWAEAQLGEQNELGFCPVLLC